MATPPYSKALHDIGITNVGTGGSGTAVIGMMLAQRQGQPQYQEFDNPLLADQFFTGAPNVYQPRERTSYRAVRLEGRVRVGSS